MLNKDFQIIAHRGASGEYPENTLLAFAKALELGCDGIEFDVQNIGGHLLVFHDETLERTTNGNGKISDHSFEQLRQLDAGQGQKIPTLREVIELVTDQAFINIELKGQDSASLVLSLLDILDKENALKSSSPCALSYRPWLTSQNFIISSYHFSELFLLRQLSSEIPIGVIADHNIPIAIDFAQEIQAYSFHPSLEAVDEKLIEQVHQLGMKLFVHTVNQESDINRMREWGVDGVFTDFPNTNKV